ncbi:hypothetical protein AVEN_218137-1, partial [Araneus ventricosus]
MDLGKEDVRCPGETAQ